MECAACTMISFERPNALHAQVLIDLGSTVKAEVDADTFFRRPLRLIGNQDPGYNMGANQGKRASALPKSTDRRTSDRRGGRASAGDRRGSVKVDKAETGGEGDASATAAVGTRLGARLSAGSQGAVATLRGFVGLSGPGGLGGLFRAKSTASAKDPGELDGQGEGRDKDADDHGVGGDGGGTRAGRAASLQPELGDVSSLAAPIARTDNAAANPLWNSRNNAIKTVAARV